MAKSYTSEFSEFLENFKQNNPSINIKQNVLRNTWWNHDEIEVVDELSLIKENRNIKAYPYFNYDKN